MLWQIDPVAELKIAEETLQQATEARGEQGMEQGGACITPASVHRMQRPLHGAPQGQVGVLQDADTLTLAAPLVLLIALLASFSHILQGWGCRESGCSRSCYPTCQGRGDTRRA